MPVAMAPQRWGMPRKPAALVSALGSFATASGNSSMALGHYATARGYASTVLGHSHREWQLRHDVAFPLQP